MATGPGTERWIDHRAAAALVLFLSVGIVSLGAQPPTAPGRSDLKWEIQGGAESRISIRGLSASELTAAARWNAEEAPQRLAVRVVVAGRPASQAVGGELLVRADALLFVPRYPLQPGVRYRTTLSLDGKEEIVRDLEIPRAPHTPTRLTGLFPTTNVVPENLLKFYLHFSAPMSRGEVYQRVSLLNSQGKRVEFPFLELAEELWSPDGQRLTLYFDPGRIKRGLKPRELFGPALVEGESYTLVIDAGWPDAQGQPLAASLKKSFRVVAPDDVQPSTKKWKLQSPPAGGREPLRIAFEEPLDAAMLIRVLEIRDPLGETVSGEIRLGEREAVWEFRPRAVWRDGRHQVIVARSLEDLAGNSLGRPFEVDMFRPADPQVETASETLEFVVRGLDRTAP